MGVGSFTHELQNTNTSSFWKNCTSRVENWEYIQIL